MRTTRSAVSRSPTMWTVILPWISTCAFCGPCGFSGCCMWNTWLWNHHLFKACRNYVLPFMRPVKLCIPSCSWGNVGLACTLFICFIYARWVIFCFQQLLNVSLKSVILLRKGPFSNRTGVSIFFQAKTMASMKTCKPCYLLSVLCAAVGKVTYHMWFWFQILFYLVMTVCQWERSGKDNGVAKWRKLSLGLFW